ncbi:metal-dependent transcriptional regulator [Christensenellaceae bacterium OttesenSCG-928-M15]|nr:metal-dependent transcriptional regulator [Christensenellaceae bacterium OttesenSCG-928-M15]
MKIQESAENYLERILMIKENKGEVRSIDIARALNFSKPSVSVAMKQFRENGYITMDQDGFIELTDKGHEIAERMYERHRVLTDMLIGLGVNDEVAREDACRIEHVISAESFESIKAHLREKTGLKETR